MYITVQVSGQPRQNLVQMRMGTISVFSSFESFQTNPMPCDGGAQTSKVKVDSNRLQ